MSAQVREVGKGPGVLLEGNRDGNRRREFEGHRGGIQSHMGKLNVAGTPYRTRVTNIILRDRIECYPCLCSKIGTLLPNYEYVWGGHRIIRERERDRKRGMYMIEHLKRLYVTTT